MSRILHNSGGESPRDALGAQTLFVRGLPYNNTAAKFWTCLIDEIVTDYPPETGVALSAPTGGLLVPELLSPESLLQRDMDQLAESDVHQAFADAVKALEILGPPCSVRLRLVSASKEIVSQEISLDYLDAEILPFLLAWLLEWAGIPDVLWNQDDVRGDFVADDQERGLRYLVAFELRSRHMSEGLFDREVVVNFRRESLTQPVPARPQL
jgi:hypothetical protein